MLIHNFDPVLIDFGVIQIRWYSLAYIFGNSSWLVVWTRFIIKKQIQNINQKKYIENFDDLIGYIIIGVIVGGRLGYVFFYNPLLF